MRLFNAQAIRQIEQKTIESSHISSLELMDRAATQYIYWLLPRINQSDSIILICGKYNNGADGLTIAEKLWLKGYKVQIWVINFSEGASDEFKFHLQRLKQLPIKIADIDSLSNFEIQPKSVVVDAIIGNGINRPIEGKYRELIHTINLHDGKIFSVDIPSGMQPDLLITQDAIRSDSVLSFQFPKLSFFLIENSMFVGSHSFACIGLNHAVIENTNTSYHYIDQYLVKSLLQKRGEHSHKGNFGHSLMIVGSLGLAGAASLCCTAAMSSGVGMCTAFVTADIIPILQSTVPEVMTLSTEEHSIASLVENSKYTIGAGPGLSINESSKALISELLDCFKGPMVLDADALNIIAGKKNLINKIPAGSILTPHPKEFQRMFGSTTDSLKRLRLQQEMAIKHELVIIVKGRNTTICMSDGDTFINSTGNSGMATAGSGDVLTGIITSLLAQGHPSSHAAIIGVYLHGLSGDIYAMNHLEHTLVASKIIDELAAAFNQVINQ